MDDQSFREQLQNLQASFIEKVPQRIERMAAQLNSSRAGDQTALHALHNELHTLFGTASTYGFKNVADEVAAFSKKLKRLEANGWPQKNSSSDELDSGLLTLSEIAKTSINFRPNIF